MPDTDLLPIAHGSAPISILPGMANRHGLIAGATGTGKTVTLRTLAEQFSRLGVPVFLADVKGDLSGLALPGGDHTKVRERAAVLGMADFAAEDLDTDDFLVVICATYGEGELPSGALPFADELDDVKPDLTGLRFAVFGMGDTVYDDTFNRGGEIMAEMLTKLGANQVGEHFRHDASSTVKPAAAAEEWAEGLKAVIAEG